MSQIKNKPSLSNIKSLEDLRRFLSSFLEDVEAVINGRIEFDVNMKTQTVTSFFPVANQDIVIQHNLNKLGLNFIVANKLSTLDIYHGVGTDTKNSIYLRSTVGGATVTVVLF